MCVVCKTDFTLTGSKICFRTFSALIFYFYRFIIFMDYFFLFIAFFAFYLELLHHSRVKFARGDSRVTFYLLFFFFYKLAFSSLFRVFRMSFEGTSNKRGCHLSTAAFTSLLDYYVCISVCISRFYFYFWKNFPIIVSLFLIKLTVTEQFNKNTYDS